MFFAIGATGAFLIDANDFFKDVFSAFLAALTAVAFWAVIQLLRFNLEDSLKIASDHHAIIRQYKGYSDAFEKKDCPSDTQFDAIGKYLRVFCVPKNSGAETLSQP